MVDVWFIQTVSGFAVKDALGGSLNRIGATVALELPQGFTA
jgi:hypothetical protein